eukprot:628136-Amphidinium_carterae.1
MVQAQAGVPPERPPQAALRVHCSPKVFLCGTSPACSSTFPVLSVWPSRAFAALLALSAEVWWLSG